MSLQHIQKNSPRLLPKPAKFEKNLPNGYRVIRKTKCGAGRAGSSPIHKQASLAGRLMKFVDLRSALSNIFKSTLSADTYYISVQRTVLLFVLLHLNLSRNKGEFTF